MQFQHRKQNHLPTAGLRPLGLVFATLLFFLCGGEPVLAAEPATLSTASADGTFGKIDYFKVTMSALAGLVLFIYGVTRLAQGLEVVAGDRMRNLVGKFTSNRFVGVLTGTAATTALESSSVTIIMVIAMVSARILTFEQSLGVVLGANIGTTIGAQLISLDINLYAPLLMGAGVLLHFIGRSDYLKNIGLSLLGFGLLFFGLDLIDGAMSPFRNYQPFLDWMRRLGDQAALGALVGAVFTVLIQSSSATVAIVITLAGSNMISLPTGIALMLGAEVGTCADTLVATLGRGRAALRTGVFHLLFNLVSALIGIALAPQLAQLAQAVSGAGSVGRQIANAQLMFNLTGVAVVIGFLPLIANTLERFLPDTEPSQELDLSLADATKNS
ncbi:MAG: Na/Pi cotransporter family protein [Blastocatellia bacterium]